MRKFAIVLLALALSSVSTADTTGTSDETLTTTPVCDLATNLPPDPGLDADATLDKVEIPTLYADVYGSTRATRDHDVEVYAGTLAVDPNDGQILGPDFLPRRTSPFEGHETPTEPGQLSAQSPAIPCE